MEAIDIESTPTATSELNGAAERIRGIIGTISRTLLIGANSLNINRSPLSTNNCVSTLETLLLVLSSDSPTRWYLDYRPLFPVNPLSLFQHYYRQIITATSYG